jgi:hypothetical protein
MIKVDLTELFAVVVSTGLITAELQFSYELLEPGGFYAHT